MLKEKIRFKDYWFYLLVIYVPIYIGIFFVVEKIVPSTADYWVSYCPLDDLIPFNEFFIIPYYLWYPFLVIVGVYLMFKDIPVYKQYMYCLIIGFTFSLIFCVLFPNGQDLRPTTFARDNICVDMVKSIYSTDTNTNVIPSIHAYGALMVSLFTVKTKTIKNKWAKPLSVIIGLLITASTCLVKQHSILDVFAAIGLLAVVYATVCIITQKRKMNS